MVQASFIIELIVIANLLSLVIGLGLYNVYRSIKRNLNPHQPDDYGPR